MQFSGKVVKIQPTDGDDDSPASQYDNPNNLLIADVIKIYWAVQTY